MTRDSDATSDDPLPPSPWPLDRRRYRIRYRKHLPSSTEELPAIVRDLVQIAERCGCVRDRQTDLEIVLHEALANAIIHGNGEHHGKRIFVRCYGAPQTGLLVLVRDEGPGFDPEEVPDPREGSRRHLAHGRGLLLMRQLTDYFEHRKNGREVLLFKTCRPERA